MIDYLDTIVAAILTSSLIGLGMAKVFVNSKKTPAPGPGGDAQGWDATDSIGWSATDEIGW